MGDSINSQRMLNDGIEGDRASSKLVPQVVATGPVPALPPTENSSWTCEGHNQSHLADKRGRRGTGPRDSGVRPHVAGAQIRLCRVRDKSRCAENKITLWDVNLDDDEDQVAYHHAVHDLAVNHIFPLLESEIPCDTLLRSGGIATYTLRTVDGSLRLVPGMVGSMKETETRWLQRLPLFDTTTDLAPAVVYDIDDVIVVGLLDEGSRGAMLATLPDHPGSRFVALWIPTFTTFAWPDEDDHAKGILHEMTFLRTIPPHPHVISPPVGYISRVRDGKKVLCGYLLEYYPGGSLGEPERAAEQPATRIKWAYQIASGLRHLHHVARTYHGDIKLANVVLDANGDAVLIDLEQGRSNEGNAAPELHAARLVSVGGDGRLHYSNPQPRTDGAGAKKHADDDDEDDEDEGEALPRLAARDRPYDIWKDIPRAIEAAEAWSFATALGPLLSDVDAAAAILAQCRKEDPNCRPTFEELEEFFLELYRSLLQQVAGPCQTT